MPQWRKLHTKITESLDFHDIPDDTSRLIWALLPLVLCREGRGIYSGPWLKSKLFPLRDDITGAEVFDRFQWFVERGMVVAYEVEGREYFYVPTFAGHQGNTTREAESNYPAPPEWVETDSADDGPEVESRSRVNHELVMSRSIPDSDSDADSDIDAEAEESGGAFAPTPAPPPPKAARKARTKDPPPPAVEVVRSATNLFPAKALWPGIVEVVGDQPDDLDRFRRVCLGWMASGWNPKNVKGMLQFHARKEIPGDNHNGQGARAGQKKGETSDRPAYLDIEHFLDSAN